jgi:hypothetical protein
MTKSLEAKMATERHNNVFHRKTGEITILEEVL